MAKQTYTTGQVLTAAQMTALQANDYNWTVSAKTASYVLVATDVGTRITMTSASATTITVNTGLFAAGDTLEIINLGAGVCTVTAGTASVSTAGSLALSQYEGGQLYFNSTGAAVFFDIVQGSGMTNPMTTTGDTIYASSGSTPARLGIGSTGQVLTVASGIPSWATPASGGGMTLLSTTTLSGASTITVSSISQSYTNLIVYIYGVTNATSNSGMSVTPNGTSGISDYMRTASSSTWTTNVNDSPGFNDTGNILRTDSTNAWTYTFYNYSSTTSNKNFQCAGGYINTSSVKSAYINGGVWRSATAISSLQFDQYGGNFSTGTVLVYGVK